jgi:hypothetical protein
MTLFIIIFFNKHIIILYIHIIYKMKDLLIKTIVYSIANEKFKPIMGDRDSQFEKTSDLPTDKIELQGIVTDLITNEFLKTDENVSKYINLITTIFDKAIMLYKRYKKIDNNYIHFVYKGGNIIRIVLRDLMHELPGKVSELIHEHFSPYFKKSDADFSIYINPQMDNFEEIYEDMTNLSYLLLIEIKGLLFNNKEKYFNLHRNKTNIIKQKLAKVLDDLNNSNAVKEDKTSRYYNKKFIRLILGDFEVNADQIDKNKENTLNKIKDSSRSDFIITYDKEYPENYKGKIQMNLYNLISLNEMKEGNDVALNYLIIRQKKAFDNVPKVEFYISVNKTLSFEKNNKLIQFNLVRMKCNLKCIIEKHSQTDTNFESNLKTYNLAGEMIDVSIPHKNSDGFSEIFQNVGDYLHTFSYEDPTNKNNFKFTGASIKYLAHDIEKILFVHNYNPWTDVKYGKRVKRLLLLYLIDLLSSSKRFTLLETRNYLNNFKVTCITPFIDHKIKDKISDVMIELDKNLKIVKEDNYYFSNFIEFYKKLLIKLKNNDDTDFQNYVILLKENFDIIKNILQTNIDYSYINRGNINTNNLYEFGSFGGTNYKEKYLKYKHKYFTLKI